MGESCIFGKKHNNKKKLVFDFSLQAGRGLR